MRITRRLMISLCLSNCPLGAQGAAADQDWTAFIAWTKALPPGALPNSRDEPFTTYLKKLTADGMSPKDAGDLVGRIRKRSVDNPEWAAVNLNRVYSQDGFHRDKPNAFLMEVISSMHAGKALDLGMGEGRNTIFLTQQGWQATGLDVSNVAVAHANEKARSLGVRIDARVQDAFAFDYGTNQWDLICLLYFYIPDTHAVLYQKIFEGLKPGGHVVIEDLGQPAMEKLMQARAKWEAAKMHLLRLEYIEGINEWRSRPGTLGRLLLQKPS